MTDEQKELNRRIAERLGWCVEEGWHASDGTPWYRVLTPKREKFPTALTADRAWLEAFGHHDWAGSVDKALELVPDNIKFHMAYLPITRQWVVVIQPGKYQHDYFYAEESADAPALAICRAWLAWQESQE